MLRKKLDQAPRGPTNATGRASPSSPSYMVLLDDKAMCKNMRCRKRFDISSVKTIGLHLAP